MWVNGVVVLEPERQVAQDGGGVRERTDADISLDGSHEGFGHSVGLRALDGRGARLQPNVVGKAPGLVAAE